MVKKPINKAGAPKDRSRSLTWRMYIVKYTAGLGLTFATGYCFFALIAKELPNFEYIQVFVLIPFVLLFLALGIILRRLFNRQEKYLQALSKANLDLENEIADHRRSKDALQESEERYRNLFENSIEGIGLSKDNEIIMANPALIRMFGHKSFEEFASTPLLDSVEPEHRELIRDKMDRGRKGELLSEKHEYNIIRKNGEIRTLEISTSEVTIQGERYVQSTFRDTTEQRQLTEQLHDTNKMEAVVTLAGGIAHQFNNALVGITGSIELLKMDMPVDVNRIKYIYRMRAAADRMASLTNQLLAYARRGRYDPQKISMSSFLINALPILESSLDPGISLDKDIPDDLPLVEADIAQMQMVLSSILYNASESLEKQGHIRISIREEFVDKALSKKHSGLKPGPYVHMEVKDTGKGMDKWVRNRIFEPFFSTKVQGRGLGMAAVYGIIKNHNGVIWVGSELGKGTVVRIYLPVVEAVEKKTETNTDLETFRGTGNILLVDDDEHVLEITRRQLMVLGYTVLTARSGEEAVEIAETSEDEIDVALLDIVMPGMGGKQAYPLIQKARPNMRVIICSGYSIDGPAKTILDAGADDFIQKPFTMAVLSKKLKQVFMNAN